MPASQNLNLKSGVKNMKKLLLFMVHMAMVKGYDNIKNSTTIGPLALHFH
jgi:hypothetical protein